MVPGSPCSQRCGPALPRSMGEAGSQQAGQDVTAAAQIPQLPASACSPASCTDPPQMPSLPLSSPGPQLSPGKEALGAGRSGSPHPPSLRPTCSGVSEPQFPPLGSVCGWCASIQCLKGGRCGGLADGSTHLQGLHSWLT